jgi:formylglycine-generating enzyme required for sulfatase activity/tRNA A-37 threonylcarbamoyl transferase component Bud32
MHLQPGQFIGRYQIQELIGQGGMAVVYKAFDTRLERPVAIKLLRMGVFPPDSLAQILQRFEREAKSLAGLSHPHIVNVLDYGEHESAPYLVLEYLPGGSLHRRVGNRMPSSEAAGLLLPVARALAYAHQRSIVHRDVKPSNILLSESGDPKLADFGIAKILEDTAGATLTGTGVGIGTPEFMAPEQSLGLPVDARADVYSLGVVLYQFVTGKTPFNAETPMQVILKHISEPLPSPRQFAPDLSEEVEQILIKALAKKPEQRYPDMSSFAEALQNQLAGQALTAAVPSPALVDAGATHYEGIATPAGQPDSQAQPLRRAPSQPLSGPFPDEAPRPAKRLPVPRWSLWACALPVAAFLLIGLPAVVIFLLKAPGLVAANPTATDPAPLTTPVAAQINSPTPTPTPPGPTPSLPTPTPSVTATLTSPPSSTFTPRPTDTPLPTATALPPIIKDALGVGMALVPAGEFLMGDDIEFSYDTPIHTVYLDAFYIDLYEVTNALYAECVQAGGCGPYTFGEAGYFDNPRYAHHPMVDVSWQEAQDYCAWRGGGLPTEAQWEKAARGGLEGAQYPWGDEPPVCTLGAVNGANWDCPPDYWLLAAGQFGANGYGLHDMAGNVWEWVVDWYGSYDTGSVRINPTGPSSGSNRILRGGGIGYSPDYLRAGVRERTIGPDDRNYNTGFRCVLSP